MRLALVSPDWPAFAGGGVAAITLTLAEAVAAAGNEVEVWTRGGGKRGRAIAQHPSPVSVIGFPGRSWAKRGARLWGPALDDATARFAPDAVLAMTWEPLAGGWRPDRAQVAVFAHGRDVTGRLDGLRKRQRDAVLDDGLRWLCLTHWMRSKLEARGVNRVSVVPAAVPVVPPVVRTSGASFPLRALTVGRLIPRKGQDVAIAAVRRLGGSVHLTIVGEGPDHERLRDLADDCPWIDIAGPLDEPSLERAWAGADVFLMPARTEPGGDTEGYGLVFLEAGVRGLPVIGGRSAGAAEAVLHETTGLLLDRPSDSIDLMSALARLAGDPSLRTRLGLAGRARVIGAHTPAHLAAAVRRALLPPPIPRPVTTGEISGVHA
ncbi:MAG: glycosyltransferase family 4 protein [Proteobacteria bacterium]|nr:glycosyltransferase family 4 protein [Pseudomonadota bacterium]